MADTNCHGVGMLILYTMYSKAGEYICFLIKLNICYSYVNLCMTV